MTLSPQDSNVSSSSAIPTGSPPSYSDSLPPRPLASTLLISPSAPPPAPPLPSLLLRAPRSSRYHHCTSGSTPIYHTHLFDLSRPVPEALLLPNLGSAENNGKRVNGLFWSERGQVKVVVGIVGRGTDEGRSPVRLVFGSRPERRGEGKVDVEILHRHPPTLPLSLSLTSTFGSLRLLLPRNFRGHLTHHHHQASSSSFPSHLILSPEVQATYTLLSNTQGFIGRFDEGESEYDASSDGRLDEAFLSTKGGTITVGFADEYEYKYDDLVSSKMDTTNSFLPSPPNERQVRVRPPMISSPLDPLLLPTTTSSSPPPFRLSPFWTRILSSSTGPFLLGLLLLGLVATVYLVQQGPGGTLQRVQQWEWNELGRMIIWTGCGMEVVAVGWLGWEVVRRLGWGR
ncbi:hypothetical protein BDY24DRAFT_86948 [Mrakia frigida]|uniref:uncharacterized protein n=1 Tax=Mrakia frigida TaxID=29902 RepID=UPI003FCBF6DC